MEAIREEWVREEDLQMIRDARAQVQAAESVWLFVQSHLARVYRLSPGDEITPSGEILRAGGEPLTSPSPSTSTGEPRHEEGSTNGGPLPSLSGREVR